MENLLKVPVDYYAITDFEGFKNIIDILGGVQIDVEKRMYYHTDYDDINLHKGLQTLDGKGALDYVRFRHDALGDITRTERQQKFMKAVMEKMLEPESIAKLPELLPAVMQAGQTDLTASKIILLAKDFSSVNMSTDVQTQTLPGSFLNMGGVSYWGVDQEKLNALMPVYFDGAATSAPTGTTADSEEAPAQ